MLSKLIALLALHIIQISVHCEGATIPPPQDPKECTEKKDICFILDRSGSVQQDGWGKELAFTTRVIKSVASQDQPDLVKFGVVTFADHPFLHIPLGVHTDIDDLIIAVEELPYTDGYTNPAKALRRTAVECFSNSTDRPDAINIVIFISDDGSTMDTSNITRATALLHQVVDIVVAIAVGPNITREVTANISKRLDNKTPVMDENFYLIRNFASLSKLGSRIVQEACEGDKFESDENVSPTKIPHFGPTEEPQKTTKSTTSESPMIGAIEGVCSKPVDICFVVDHSGSINLDDWKLTLRFVNRIIDHLNVSTEMSHIGLVSFANEATLDVELGSHSSFQDLQNTISGLPYSEGYQTNTAAALRLTANGCFNSPGDREAIVNVVIFLTDGMPNVNVSDMPEAIQAFHTSVQVVISVGLGPAIREEFLVNISKTERNSKNLEKTLGVDYFLMPDFSSLFDMVLRIASQSCPKPINGCRGGSVDICFILDSSGSVKLEGWQHTLAFLQSVVTAFQESQEAPYFGVVTFGGWARTRIQLGAPYEDLHRDIEELRYLDSTTNTSAALRVTARECFSSEGDRADAVNLAFFISDGKPTDASDLDAAIEELKAAADAVFSVGIGEDIDEDILLRITKTFDDADPLMGKHFFLLEGFDSLQGLVDGVVEGTCT